MDDGYIPFKCINVLLDNIFDGTFKEYRLSLSLKLQSLSLLNENDNVIHKDLFLDFILKENQYLLHEFECSIQLLYFHFNLNNKNIIKRDDTTRALQYILKGLPSNSINDIANMIQNISDNSDDNNNNNGTNGNALIIDNNFFIKPYGVYNVCKGLFQWKQQFFYHIFHIIQILFNIIFILCEVYHHDGMNLKQI